MIRIQLSEIEVQELEEQFRQATDRKLRDRLQIVRWPTGAGRTDIAADLGLTPRTVQRWLNAYWSTASPGSVPGRPRGPTRGSPPAMAERGPPLGHRRAGRARAGPGQLDPRGAGRPPAQDARHPDQPLGRAAVLQKIEHPPLPADLPLPARRPGQAGEGRGGPGGLEKKRRRRTGAAEPGRGPLPDGADAGPTLGVKGHRPLVGTRDCKDVLYVFAVVNLVTGVLHANTLESRRRPSRDRESKTRRMQKAFAAHLRHVGRLYPREHQRVVLMIDNAPWHRGKPIDAGAGGEPAPGVLPAAQLQPAAERDRAVLEEAAAAGDAQPAVRHAG